MKFQLLPYYFKRIGLVIFILGCFPSFVSDFVDGWNDAGDPSEKLIDLPKVYFGFHPSETFFNVTEILGLVGLLIYALSKDKIFDEFLLKLRLESVQITFFISLLVVMLAVVFQMKWKIDASYLLYFQMIGFLVIYNIKKRLVITVEPTQL